MSINHLQNMMRLQAQAILQNVAHPRLGTVSAYDPNNYAVKVIFQPDGTESGWLPIMSPWVGNGWGLFSPPSIGQAVSVHFQEGSHEAGLVHLGNFNDVERPLATPAGEFWLVHQTGSSIKITNNGAISIHTNQNCNVTVNGAASIAVTGNVTASAAQWNVTGNVNVTGDITASGNVSDQNGAKGTMQHIRDVYDTHTHGGVSPGSGNTAVPNQTL